MFEEVAEQVEFLGRELHGHAGLHHFGLPRVDRDVVELEAGGTRRAGRRRRAVAGPPQQRLDAGQQLHRLERLHQIVVGAELQADDAVHDLTARGEHQDGRGDPALAQRAAYIEAVALRQHDVEHHEIEGARERARQAQLAVARGFDVVALRCQPIAQRELQAGLVFHEQHASFGH